MNFLGSKAPNEQPAQNDKLKTILKIWKTYMCAYLYYKWELRILTEQLIEYDVVHQVKNMIFIP